MTNDLKWLIGSDFHIPYEDPDAMSIWWQVMEWFKPDVIDILGDLDDNSACSKYSDGTPDEVINGTAMYAEFVQQFFARTRELNPDSQIHFATGNHELRFDDYINKKAKAFKGLITPELLWGTDRYGIDLSYYDKPPVHRFGDIWVHHGLYSAPESGGSVKKMVDDFGVSCIVGHCHRAGSYFKTYKLRNETLRGYELGHMADVTSAGMSYDTKHNWQQGFAIAHIVNGHPHVQLISIHNGTAVVDGKVFTVD